ncbi:MAG: alpha-amylase domain-containing protein [Bacteroidota bacterium]
MHTTRTFLLAVMCLIFSGFATAQNPWNGKVVLQGFWWDYENANYPDGWANYLTELAPRLRDMGIDAVWIPPAVKNNSPGSVGYSPFDHYDLGDKYQKGNLKTRLGTKDELLRMIAVLHANGIEVIQDMVLNHIDNAGSSTGAGGQDPFALANFNDGTTSGYKNFRYSSYATPVVNSSATDYLNRSGRWPKNWPNFYPNQFNSCCNNDLNSVYWGPDISYESNAYGQSSCSGCYNPVQSANYMRDQGRDWFVWFKKQTDVDGYRFDAVKHFPTYVVEDYLWNAQFNAGFASGGSEMFSVGEYVGSGSQMDNWANAVQNRAGTFDFSLRGGIYNMVYGMGNYDIGSIPGQQQGNRQRTVPFVNNHDTYRPIVDANGNYVGWNTGSELAAHIDPNEPRLEAAYAVAMSVDGSPQVFFEDLFDIESPNRWNHDPKNSTQLPVRDAIANIIWCHQKLSFKAGAYKVRHQSQDNLIIERSGRAIIGVNDHWTSWQGNWIPTDFAPGTQLHDYSGANSNDIWVDANGWVQIWTPPCNGSNVRRGYTIWGPAGIGGGFSPGTEATTNEWEMADDLGDSHANSLGQGGQVPANSTAWRTAGRVFSSPGTIAVNLFTSDATQNLTVAVFDGNGSTQLATNSGTGNLTLNYSAPADGYYTLKVRNSSAANPGQNVWVRANYTAPQVVNTAVFKTQPAGLSTPAPQPSLEAVLYPNPAEDVAFLEYFLPGDSYVSLEITDALGRTVYALPAQWRLQGAQRLTLPLEGLNPGMYFYRLNSEHGVVSGKLMHRE